MMHFRLFRRGGVSSVSCPEIEAKCSEKSFPTESSVPNSYGAWSENNDQVQINRVSLQEVARDRVSDLIRECWPAETDAETARQCGKAIGVDPRTVRNWLNCTHSAAFENIFAIGCIVGVFRVMDVMTRGQSRLSILNKIARGVRYVAGQ